MAASMHAQSLKGLKLSIGPSFVRNTIDYTGQSHKVLPSLSFQIGVFKEWDLNGAGRLGLEVLGNYFQSLEKFEYNTTDDVGVVNGWVKGRVASEFLYLAVPIWYGLDFGKWTASLGVQVSVGKHVGYFSRSTSEIDGVPRDQSFAGSWPVQFRPDFGPKAGLLYHHNDRWTFEGNVYYGFVDTYDTYRDNRSNMMQATFGAKWNL